MCDRTDDVDVKVVAARIRRLNAAERRRIAARKDRARQKAHEVASHLAQADLAVVTVWGFGSTFEADRPYRMDSDVDIAVEGGNLYALMRHADKYEIPVDLVDTQEVSETMAVAIRKRGTVLYSRAGNRNRV